MRTVLAALIILFLAVPALAANWMRISDIESGSVAGFELESACRNDGYECLRIDGHDLAVSDLTDSEVDDLNRPKFVETKSEACADPVACQAVIAAPEFCEEGEQALYRETGVSEYLAYCVVQSGFHKKTVKELQVNPTKLAAKQAAESAASLVAAKEAAVAAMMKRIDFGKRVIALMSVRNGQKNLSNQDFLAMLADPTIQAIKGLLETGATTTARDAIAAFDVENSTYFTAEDRDSLLAEIDSFIAANGGAGEQ